MSLPHEQVLIRYDDSRIQESDLKQTLQHLGYTIRDADRVRAIEKKLQEMKHTNAGSSSPPDSRL